MRYRKSGTRQKNAHAARRNVCAIVRAVYVLCTFCFLPLVLLVLRNSLICSHACFTLTFCSFTFCFIPRKWDKEVKHLQKQKANEIKSAQNISATDAKKTEEYKLWNSDLLAMYADKVDELKNRLTEEYQLTKQKQLPDYPIFMAIAEQIGYDATGKKIAVNELDIIGEELKKFIDTL